MNDVCILDHAHTLRVLECYTESFSRIAETLLDCRRRLSAARTPEEATA